MCEIMIYNLEDENHRKHAVPHIKPTSNEEHMVTAQLDAGSSYCSDSCKCKMGVTNKILTRQNIYACLFIYTQQAPVVKVTL